MESIIDAPLDLSGYAAQLYVAGVRTVVRYYNNKNSTTFPSKRLTKTELAVLFDAGFSVATVFQQRGGAQGNLDDLSTANGKRDGAQALDLASDLKQPEGSAIYFAVDHDYVRGVDLNQIAKYFAAARAELNGRYKVGVYGSGLVGSRLTGEGLVEHVWLAGATGWSGTKAELAAGNWSLFQKYLSKTSPIGGFGYDGNIVNAGQANFGQFAAVGNAKPALVDTPVGMASDAIYEVTAVGGLNLRGGPGQTYSVLQNLAQGRLVTGIRREGDWMKVDLEGDGQADGYVFTQYLRAASGGVPIPHDTVPGVAVAPIDVARQELALGVAEVPGSTDNPRIRMYHATTEGASAGDETAWCSSFVNYCVERAGLVGTDSKWALDWKGWGAKVTDPQVGDIVVFSRVGGGDDGGHVGFYLEQEGGENGTVLVLGGNQSNKVCKQRYPKHGTLGPYRYDVVGFRRG